MEWLDKGDTIQSPNAVSKLSGIDNVKTRYKRTQENWIMRIWLQQISIIKSYKEDDENDHSNITYKISWYTLVCVSRWELIIFENNKQADKGAPAYYNSDQCVVLV